MVDNSDYWLGRLRIEFRYELAMRNDDGGGAVPVYPRMEKRFGKFDMTDDDADTLNIAERCGHDRYGTCRCKYRYVTILYKCNKSIGRRLCGGDRNVHPCTSCCIYDIDFAYVYIKIRTNLRVLGIFIYVFIVRRRLGGDKDMTYLRTK